MANKPGSVAEPVAVAVPQRRATDRLPSVLYVLRRSGRRSRAVPTKKGNSLMTRQTHARRWAVIVVLLLMASLAPVGATAGDSAPQLETESSHVGTPAPVRVLPICERLPEGDSGACPTESEFLTVQTSGSFGGVGVTVTAVPSIPPCATWDIAPDIWGPSPCYSEVTFGGVGCQYLDESSGELVSCPSPFLTSSLGVQLTRESDTRTPSGEGPWDFCGSDSNFSVYYRGGPANTDPDLTWPGVAPTTLACRMELGATPDNLMGATWFTVSVSLTIRRSGESRTSTAASAFVTANGLLGPNAPEPTTEDPPTPPDDPEVPSDDDELAFEPIGPFTDVPTGSFARSDIKLLLDLGITNGVSSTEYGPQREVTREQMAAFLGRTWRALGESCPDTTNPFDDVALGSFAHDDVGCIFGLGITTGVSDTEYRPGGAVTREQMAAFLGRMWRALGNECETGPTGFTDVPESSFAALDVECLFFAGITKGVSATEFAPEGRVTREQMAAFLARLYRAHTG